jgi:hypothetical protein
VEQLKHLKPHERPYVLGPIANEMGLEQYGTNASKGSLCKTSEKCIRRIVNVVFPYMIQFCHGPNGENLKKEYGIEK